MSKPSETQEASKTGIRTIPPRARILTSIGDQTAQAVEELYRHEQGTFWAADDRFDIGPLGEALISTGWTDHEAARLISTFAQMMAQGRRFEIKSLARWARFHVNDADTVKDCMEVEPPPEIDLIKILSRKGSQKLVFLATWRKTLQEVVLKQIIAKGESAERIFSRELQPHPLNMVHPNIIETHFLRNSKGERFLVERRLDTVLDDEWEAQGIHEASNLLFDITKALKFLNDHQLVHGDVKPDNIGKRGGSYVLLDFGICRDRKDFSSETTATGSLRTRAPELLVKNVYGEPEMVDIWALGATVYKAVTKRFPLIEIGEPIPRNTEKGRNSREKFEEILKERVEKEWNRYVDLTVVPPPLREVIAPMLERNPSNRISTSALLEKAEKELSAFLRSSSQVGDSSGRFSPLDELNQVAAYLHSINNDAKLIPRHKKQAVLARLRELENTHGFNIQQRELLGKIVTTIS